MLQMNLVRKCKDAKRLSDIQYYSDPNLWIIPRNVYVLVEPGFIIRFLTGDLIR